MIIANPMQNCNLQKIQLSVPDFNILITHTTVFATYVQFQVLIHSFDIIS